MARAELRTDTPTTVKFSRRYGILLLSIPSSSLSNFLRSVLCHGVCSGEVVVLCVQF